MLKRSFDIAVSLAFLCTLFPIIYIIIGIAIKLDSPGPVLFRQLRHGKGGRIFTLLKFRTMIVNEEADTRQATSGDKRITGIGSFLRDTSLDELPQFINVLKGEMSVVGPRPHMLYHTGLYSVRIKDYMKRLSVKPGITGMAQILGYRGETQTDEEMARRIRIDLWYIRHQSFRLDIYIFMRTCSGFLRGFIHP